MEKEIQDAFKYCEEISSRHYENFPVASMFLSKVQRRAVSTMYAFARTADDFADEGSGSIEERLHHLQVWEDQLEEAYRGRAKHPVFIALMETIERYSIPIDPFHDLLNAFRMDVLQNRFETFTDLLHYCRHSANPIGRLVLHLFHDASARTFSLSDHICTALQLTNFWQDVHIDWAKGRLYIPLEDLDRFGYTEHDIELKRADERFMQLMNFEVQRTRNIFEEGKALLEECTPDLRLELLLTWYGGTTILRKINPHSAWTVRPVLTPLDKISILLKSIFRRMP